MNPLREFLRLEAAAGILLMAAAAAAIALDNSPLAPIYGALLELPVEVRVGGLALAKPLLLWVNEGLMAVFFLLVGLELKRELVEGELSQRGQAMLPLAAALGGMALPGAIYALVNLGDSVALRGWAIPTATDIAFALAVLSLLGPRVPPALKAFLTAVAIIDDLGAIVVIAAFYTAGLSWLSLGLAACALALLLALNLMGVARVAAYVVVGVALWVFVLKSGVHATLAGVAIGLAVPLRSRGEPSASPLRHLEHILHPWVAYLVVPLFGFANAGVSLREVGAAELGSGVTLGTVLGLVVGKQLGVFGGAWLAVRSGLAALPEGAGWSLLYGACCLTGIGFTMSLFIGTLAFEGQAAAAVDYAAATRIAVIAGTLLSGLLGVAVLSATLRRQSLPLAGS